LLRLTAASDLALFRQLLPGEGALRPAEQATDENCQPGRKQQRRSDRQPIAEQQRVEAHDCSTGRDEKKAEVIDQRRRSAGEIRRCATPPVQPAEQQEQPTQRAGEVSPRPATVTSPASWNPMMTRSWPSMAASRLGQARISG